MLKNILELQGVEKLDAKQRKNIKGGMLGIGQACPSNGDAICCGTANWQCGTGPSGGGIFEGIYFNGNPVCACF
ncbi:hypothetical protein [Aquimarina litoralis]|uniref:hypothetical protein n=1 Tax=Aquimarina litoralis TaxID=584605 RepID=UPI001C56D772|nr:hypothetical protein [Aquimarina litoralis]MBW1298852.1 hypothetical protein [Aquimarina litoralis]